MSEETVCQSPPRSFWIISTVALLWNMIGIATYLMSVTMAEAALDAMTEAERGLYANIPWWATSAYASAVFGGTLGSAALLLRKGWAVPLLILSLVAIVVQMGHALLGSAMIEVKGLASAALPIIIIAIASYLVWFARSSRSKGWIG